MKMTEIKHKIFDYISNNIQVQTIVLINHFGMSRQAMQVHLKQLVTANMITKVGVPPNVYYSVSPRAIDSPAKLGTSILDEFQVITPVGNLIEGADAMVYWTDKRDFNYNDYIIRYGIIKSKYNNYKDSYNLIDATEKMKNTFRNSTYIDKAYIGEFSSIEIFGKTPIYAKLLYAKLGSNKKLMIDLFEGPKKQILEIIKIYKIDMLGFVTPTVDRKVQLMDELRKYLNINLPIIKIVKIKNQYAVPQKTLKLPTERIENAINTFIVPQQVILQNILLIDDFVGSGSSLNYISEKIKKIQPNCQIITYAIAGTPNGIVNVSKEFEVVNEA
jgi:hypothetical protein